MRREHELILAELFGPDVAVACVDVGAVALDPAFQDEPWFTQAPPPRQREFSAGRACASRVLLELGRSSLLVARGASGEPIWPVGVVGSISHSGGLCVAVAGRASEIGGIGVDIEPDHVETAAFARRICSEVELSALRELGEPIEASAPVVFSAKEASYKLQFPMTGDAGAWPRLEVLLSAATFSVRLDRSLGNRQGPLARGNWRRALGFIWAGVTLRPS